MSAYETAMLVHQSSTDTINIVLVVITIVVMLVIALHNK